MNATRYVLMVTLLILLQLSTVAQAVTRYVSTSGSDSNSCSASQSQATPKRNITGGSGALTCLAAGDTLYLRGGTYNEGINPAFDHIPSGSSWTNAITLASFPNETAIITGGIAIQDNLDLSIVSYWIFDRLALQNTNNPALFLGGQSHHIRLQNSDLQTFGNQGSPHIVFISSNTDSHEILSSKLHDAPVSQFLSNDPTTTSNYGCYCYGRHMLIDGNTFYNNTGYAIHHYHSGDPNVSNNIIRNNIIYGNAYDDGTRALQNCAVIMTSGSNNYFYNNLVYNNNCGVQIGGNSGNFVYNNTITSNTGLGLQLDTITDSLTMRNNIVYANGNGSAQQQIADFGSTNTTQSNNVIVNPLFTNAAAHDYTLQNGSVAKDTGFTVAAVQTDITGLARPQGSAYDVGAYEGVGTPVPTAFTVYVATNGDDSRSCTTAQNIATPKLTIASGWSCLFVSGSTLYIRGGTYSSAGLDTGTVAIASGADWAHATKIAGYAQEVVTINVTSGLVGMWFRNSDSYVIIDRLIINMQGAGNGFVVTPGSDHIRFQNGEVKNTLYEPFYVDSASNIEILSNLIHDWTYTPGVAGVTVNAVSTNVKVQGNTIYNGPGVGVRADGASTAQMNTVSVIGNRIHNVGATENVAAVLLGGTNNTGSSIVNNIIYNNYAGVDIVNGASGVKVYNNTLYGQSSYAITVRSGAINTELKNNLMFSNGTTITDGGSGTTVASNRTDNPTFVSAGTGDFNLQATSTAIDSGVTLTLASPDIANVTRPQNTSYDVGALEFTGTPDTGGGSMASGGAVRSGMMWGSRMLLFGR